MSTNKKRPKMQRHWRWALYALIFALVCLLAVILAKSGNIKEYRLYLTEDRKQAELDISSLSEEWTEATVRRKYLDYPVTCVAYQGSLPVQRACAVDVSATNEIPTLYMSFFFSNGRLDQVSINIPWWSHEGAYYYLVRTFGRPDTSQEYSRNGIRLHGWQLASGGAVFFNRDRPIIPLDWNAIYWRSASACKTQGCFTN